jgi:hypothetical protein
MTRSVNRSLNPSAGSLRTGTNSTPRIGIGVGRGSADCSARAAGLERHVHDLGWQVVADVQEPARLDVKPGLLFYLPDESSGQSFAVFQLAAGQAPRPAGTGRVLVKKEEPGVLDDDPGHANPHPVKLRDGLPRNAR